MFLYTYVTSTLVLIIATYQLQKYTFWKIHSFIWLKITLENTSYKLYLYKIHMLVSSELKNY